MMGFLVTNILGNRWYLRLTDGEGTVATLPVELIARRILFLYPERTIPFYVADQFANIDRPNEISK